MQVLRTIAHPDGLRRARIVDRGGGRFGYDIEQWNEQDRCWLPYGGPGASACDSPGTAEREALARLGMLEEDDESSW